MNRCESGGGLQRHCRPSVFDAGCRVWAERGHPGRLHATCSAVARRMGSALSRAWFVRSEAWYSSLDHYFASPVATADSVAPADFGRRPKAPQGREKGRDDRPRPHSPGWPCPWRYSQPLQRTISPRATVNGASSTAKARWPFGSPWLACRPVLCTRSSRRSGCAVCGKTLRSSSQHRLPAAGSRAGPFVRRGRAL